MLYQLSYASSIPPRKLSRLPEERAGTLTLRTYYGTGIKVSIPATAEQTRKRQETGIGKPGMARMAARVSGDSVLSEAGAAGGAIHEIFPPPDELRASFFRTGNGL